MRISLGALTAREARRQADLLGALARNRFEQLRAQRMERQPGEGETEEHPQFDGGTPEMTAAEIKGYLKAMRQVIGQPAPPTPPHQVPVFAGLKGLVEINRELAKGAAGNPLIVDNAEMLNAQSIARIMGKASGTPRAPSPQDRPAEAIPPETTPASAASPLPKEADSDASIDAPSPTTEAGATTGVARVPAFKLDRRYVPRKASDKPLFSEVAEEYFAEREASSGVGNKDIGTARFRAGVFVELIGNHPIDTYTATDLQAFIYLLTHWPALAKDRPAGKPAREILANNADLTAKPLKLNALRNGYVAIVKSIVNARTTAYEYDYPFKDAKLRYPKTAEPAQAIEPISDERLNAIFRIGVGRGLLDEAMLPLLGRLTSRRLGLLVHLQGNDFREKYPGVWVAQTAGIKLMGDGTWRRIPIKTEASTTFFVLHDFLREIGFTEWAAGHGDRFLFPELIRLADPSKSASQYMRRLFRRAGVKSVGKEVFHSLRGAGIEQMRDTKVDARDRKLQAGHKLEAEHDLYGFKAISEIRAREMACGPLPEGLDFSVFRGLDFDKLAKSKRTMGRRPKQ
ncbi:MAG: hypothetical protein MEQ84_02675 [Mesorhizobium sp.]|nr:hypothetical protein [Mesorhizobium sp.]